MVHIPFVIGEYVVRMTDGQQGRVVSSEMFNGTLLYRVCLRPGQPPTDENTVLGYAQAWIPLFTQHAHIATDSADCDGSYTREWVEFMSDHERTQGYGDDEFKYRVAAAAIDLNSHGEMRTTPDRVEWSATTEEGYVHTTISWCVDPSCTPRRSQRDHRAEAAGY